MINFYTLMIFKRISLFGYIFVLLTINFDSAFLKYITLNVDITLSLSSSDKDNAYNIKQIDI